MLPQRVKLYEKLPLKTPFSLHIFPIYLCNFKCNYCIQALSKKEMQEKNFKKDIMSFETYKKAIDDICEYEDKLKALIFAGHGEPLMHPDIDKMVLYAKEKNVADRVEITTNGSLLTKEMSDKLIKAGVDRLKISIQGTNEDNYLNIAKYKINYASFIDNLTYFNNNKHHTEVYIKIIDIALNNKIDEEKFKAIFKPISSYVGIEYAIPFVKEIDHSLIKKDFNKCKQGNTGSSKICSMPFYMQVLDPRGNILPCCSTDIPLVLGNIHKNSLKEIWESQKQVEFLKLLLKNKDLNHVCKSCSVPEFGLQNGDYLDEHRNILLKKYTGEK